MNINIYKKITIFIVGVVSSVLVWMIVTTLFADTFNSFFAARLGNIGQLYFVVLGLTLQAILISIVTAVIVEQTASRLSIIKTSIMAYISMFATLYIVVYISLFLLYSQVFEQQFEGINILLNFPAAIVIFGIYILENIFLLYLFIFIIYFLFFIIYLEVFYRYARV